MKNKMKKIITVMLLGFMFITTHFPEVSARYIGSLNVI